MSDTSKLKVGSRVVSTGWRGGGGTIERISRGVAFVRSDDQNGLMKERLIWLREETADDVTKRESKRMLAEWRDRKPTTTIARVEHDPSWGSPRGEIGAALFAGTPDDMRTAAAELLQLAAWFETRPNKEK